MAGEERFDCKQLALSSPECDVQQLNLSVFVYGTLCVPAVLLRVLRTKGEGLTFQDAIVQVSCCLRQAVQRNVQLIGQGYTRHSVKGQTYPALLETERAEKLSPNLR
jgi:hypothetical protein